ncbi:uncharacterized protein [Lolium perenne]|uniref:uncharacterized protein n=1 Tax=Lolium perenne TaxID=4522 RepID=UPI0021F5397A|nr:uncharacterized protein LOC127341176 [Lolium perenne]
MALDHAALTCSSPFPFNPHLETPAGTLGPSPSHPPPVSFPLLFSVNTEHHRELIVIAPPYQTTPRRFGGTRRTAASSSCSWRKESSREAANRRRGPRFRFRLPAEIQRFRWPPSTSVPAIDTLSSRILVADSALTTSCKRRRHLLAELDEAVRTVPRARPEMLCIARAHDASLRWSPPLPSPRPASNTYRAGTHGSPAWQPRRPLGPTCHLLRLRSTPVPPSQRLRAPRVSFCS